eukprot:TRINITY_DN13908_c0_g1_i1.p1 TRINITY_DN13908_c0_g1~~TRINITY_DN13908_c0_g1_i1.p1  ORF type:complete len:104 (-),score=1.82 TRINITY_DN13908_c0_g1_i1:52-363(-)
MSQHSAYFTYSCKYDFQGFFLESFKTITSLPYSFYLPTLKYHAFKTEVIIPSPPHPKAREHTLFRSSTVTSHLLDFFLCSKLTKKQACQNTALSKLSKAEASI